MRKEDAHNVINALRGMAARSLHPLSAAALDPSAVHDKFRPRRRRWSRIILNEVKTRSTRGGKSHLNNVDKFTSLARGKCRNKKDRDFSRPERKRPRAGYIVGRENVASIAETQD